MNEKLYEVLKVNDATIIRPVVERWAKGFICAEELSEIQIEIVVKAVLDWRNGSRLATIKNKETNQWEGIFKTYESVKESLEATIDVCKWIYVWKLEVFNIEYFRLQLLKIENEETLKRTNEFLANEKRSGKFPAKLQQEIKADF